MKKYFSVIMACMMTIIMLTNCSSSGADSKSEKRTFKVASAYDVSTLYPYTMQQTQGDGLFQSMVYDPLLRPSGEDRHEEMCLAESYEYNEDKTELIFHLRKGVKFHSGTEMKASDVVFSYNHYCEEHYNSGFTGVKGVRAEDDYTVIFDLDYVYSATVPSEIQFMMIISEEYYNEMGDGDSYGENPVGTGPYKFVSWEKNAKIELESFGDSYKGTPSFDGVEIVFMTDASARANALEAGDVDLAEVDSTSLEIFKDNDSFHAELIETPSCNGPLFNADIKEFSDVRVRRAMAYAIAREQMVAAIYPDGGAGATSVWMPSVLTGYVEDVPQYEYDPDKAKQLMKEAGYENGFDGGDIICNNLGAGPAQVLQAQWEKIGIKINIQTLETAAYYDALFKKDYQIAFMNFGPEIAHIAYTGRMFSTDGDLNFMGYSNKELDALYEQLEKEVDETKIMELAKDIGTVIQEEVPWIKCFSRDNIYILSSDLEGFEPVDIGLNMYTLK